MKLMIAATNWKARNPSEPLNADCQHKVNEDCFICSICGLCREDLDADDVCMDCGGIEERFLV
jgi:hypothetical protein